ncbi:MAG: transposase [Gammaproteobacteria bacterium]|nr:transposase [Gammaproteobacteria bacterium]
MMGELPPDQNQLFYDISLEKMVPGNHFLRAVDQFLDFAVIREHLSEYYSHTGRPSVDPELMIRMLLIGYSYGIRSERRLVEEVKLNVAYRWFCRLGLEGEVPHHSTFTKNRLGRFKDANVFKLVFHTVLTRCIDAGLVKGEGFAVDGSFVQAASSRHSKVAGPVDWTPEHRKNRTVKEYLEALESDPKHKRVQNTLSLNDPNAQWTAAKGPADFYYSTNYVVDTKYSIIMDVEASAATYSKEVATLPGQLDRIKKEHGIQPNKIMGDTAYGTAECLHDLVDNRGIEPHVPVWDKSAKNSIGFDVSDFTYDDEHDIYICPEGEPLKSSGRINKDDSIRYRSYPPTCRVCPNKNVCTPNMDHRKIRRHRYEAARNIARKINQSTEYIEVSQPARKKVEMAFAHMKQVFNFRRLRLRGMSGANDEFTLVATAQNLRKLVRLAGIPPPA